MGSSTDDRVPVDGHAGQQAVAAMMAFGTDTMFTLNGGHIWPLYDGARNLGMRVVDTRHEQTATFAAEAYAKLTRRPGLAALTAGPGITNGVSAITTAWFNGTPLVVLGGRAPQGRWGAGSLQEMDHVPIVASITKSAGTVKDATTAAAAVHEAAVTALTPHRGPTFLDVPMDVMFAPSAGSMPAVDPTARLGLEPDPDALAALAELIGNAARPAFVVGSDVYWDGAWGSLRAAVGALAGPVLRQRARPRHAPGRPRAGLPAHPRPAQEPRRSRRRGRHAARLPPRFRPLRQRPGRPRGGQRGSAGPPRRRADGRRRHRRDARALADGRARSGPRRLDRRAPRR